MTTATDSSVELFTDFDLSKHNTMALCCHAKQAVVLTAEQQIPSVFRQLDNTGSNVNANVDETAQTKANILLLSGGSNIILPKELSAVAILPRYRGIKVIREDDRQVEIEVMAGNNWHELVVDCTNNGWYGLENLALIPGLVGASPVQNIGAYGVQLEDCLSYVKVFHIPSQTWQIFNKDECQFAYRDSIFKQNPNTWLISRVAFVLHKDSTKLSMGYGDVATKAQQLCQQRCEAQNDTASNSKIIPVDVMNAIIEIRQSKLPDPQELANTGSFFQNPIIQRTQYTSLLAEFPDMPKYDIDDERVKVPAGWLIDKAGLKGQGIAPILTHKKQALVLTNHAPYQATQRDIAKTRDLIIETVIKKYDIRLQAEPVWISGESL